MIRGALPTTDLYFLNSCGRWINRWWRSGPVEQLSANCFRCGDNVLLIRRDEPRFMEQAIRGSHRLIYLIDDDIEGAAQSSGLPADYQERLARFAERDYDRLIRRADIIVASSAVLATRLTADNRSRAKVHVLDPFWALPLADQRHFDACAEGRIHMAHLGTASHSGGLTRLTPAILEMLGQFSEARFTYVGRHGTYPMLDAHPRAQRIGPMSWSRYRRWLPNQRFHLAVYPLENTPFDRARSANKLIEHAIVGANGIYPEDWNIADALGSNALLAPSDPAQWAPTLLKTVAQSQDLAALAGGAAAAVAARYGITQQQRFWAQLFGLQEKLTS